MIIALYLQPETKDAKYGCKRITYKNNQGSLGNRAVCSAPNPH